MRQRLIENKIIMRRFLLLIVVCSWCGHSFAAKGNFFQLLAQAALGLTSQKVTYDPSYFKLKYPMGDVPADKGVCTDVVIRAYRRMGTDLQQLVHEDMQRHFSMYPGIWGSKTTDKNIDHRRVPNLMVFFKREGAALTVSHQATDYQPGDLVCWDLGNGVTHIGIVSGKMAAGGRYGIVHNIGAGQVWEDCLFHWKIIGHYRYQPR